MRRLLGALVTVVALLAAGCGAEDLAPSAADQVPSLSLALERVDTTLAAHRFTAARAQLHELKTMTVKARDAGELDAADAGRVLAAVARLLAMLPAKDTSTEEPAGPSPSETVDTTRPTESPSSHPQRTRAASSAPAEPRSSSPAPTSAAPTSSVPSPTPDASPTAAATSTP